MLSKIERVQQDDVMTPAIPTSLMAYNVSVGVPTAMYAPPWRKLV